MKIFVKVVVLFILFLIPKFLISDEIVLKGRNVNWSPDADEFLYFAYGKASMEKIWRIYSLKTRTDIDTVFYGEDTIPAWSIKGNFLAYAKDNIIKIVSAKTKKDIKTSTQGIKKISWSPDSERVVYSDGEKIYILKVETVESSFFTFGNSPVWLRNGEGSQTQGIIYMDNNFNLFLFDRAGEHRLIKDDCNTFSVSYDGSLIAFDNGERNRICIISLNNRTTNEIVFKDIVYGFNFSGDNKFLIAGLMKKGLYIYDIIRGLKFPLEIVGFYPGWSVSSGYISYEKGKKIYIKNSDEILKQLDFSNIFKISFGKKDGLRVGEELEVYEEKANPLTGKVTGYDISKPKGKLKVISVFNSYSFGKVIEKNKRIELNDALYSKRLNFVGNILATE